MRTKSLSLLSQMTFTLIHQFLTLHMLQLTYCFDPGHVTTDRVRITPLCPAKAYSLSFSQHRLPHRKDNAKLLWLLFCALHTRIGKIHKYMARIQQHICPHTNTHNTTQTKHTTHTLLQQTTLTSICTLVVQKGRTCTVASPIYESRDGQVSINPHLYSIPLVIYLRVREMAWWYTDPEVYAMP